MTKKNATLKQERLEQACQLIQAAQHPLLICHIAPDGDAIGSLTGLGRALRQKRLEPTLACSDLIPTRFNYIPEVAGIAQDVSVPLDLVISLDCSDLERLGHLTQAPDFENAPLLNIDHHLTNLYFGDVNLVDAHASSSAEVMLRLLEYMAVPLDAETSICLLTGIVTDTHGFRTSNVTAPVMEAILRLMKAGASLSYITHHSLNCRPVAAIFLWRAALSSLQIEDRVIWTSISLTMRRAAGYTGHSDAGLVSFLIGAEDADAAVVFVECDDDRVEVGLRAVPGFDVAQVALQFGGGGHALAAGCTLPGPLQEAQVQVLDALQNVMRPRPVGMVRDT